MTGREARTNNSTTQDGVAMYLDQYKLEGTLNLDEHPCLFDPATYPDFLERYEQFKHFLLGAVGKQESRAIYKFGYGDYLFLTRQSEGSASVGFRALNKPYDLIDHKQFEEGASCCDYYTCEIYPDHVARFKEVINRKIDFPAEYGYACVANRWLFRTFAGKIGLIGADKKIAVIKRLMKTNTYQDYLGLEKFEDYISIPQRFACDNLAETEQQVAEQLRQSTSKIFLVGIGHVKSGLLHRMKNYTNAVFLDVGQGLDAIAGLIDTEKPFFGNWINHRADEPALYEDIDYLSYLPYAFINSTIRSIKV